MAIVTPRFTIALVNFDLPHASEYVYTPDYTSVPLKMANGRTVWQTFVIQGDDEAGFIHRIRVGWNAMTLAQTNVLTTVFDDLRSGTLATFRTPEDTQFSVTIDPDHPTWDYVSFAAIVSGVPTLRYRTTIYLLQDTA